MAIPSTFFSYFLSLILLGFASAQECNITQPCPLNICCSQYGFCGITPVDHCGEGCQSGCTTPSVPDACDTESQPQIKVGYYASWGADRICNSFQIWEIPAKSYTHLNYAFGSISSGILSPGSAKEEQDFAEILKLKQSNPDLKVLLAVGGYAFNDPGPTQLEFHYISASPQNRTRFINSVLSFLDSSGFDGIDIDWEYPGAEDRGGRPEDKANYVQLLRDMRISLGARLITIAAPASYWYLQHFDVAGMVAYLDWINVMSYDYNGVWNADKIIRPHTSILDMEESLKLFVRAGAPLDKLVMGLGFYGRGYRIEGECPSGSGIGCQFAGPSKPGNCTQEEGVMALSEIHGILSASAELNWTLHEESKSKTLRFDSDQIVTYDDEQTLQVKKDWAVRKCLKGVMVWSVDQGLEKETSGQESSNRLGVGFVVIATTLGNLFLY